MNEPLPPQYNPAEIERALYQWWQSRGTWRHEPDDPRAPYVIMMPPPNVTDRLHMGHGLNLTIQDTLVRFERMRGRAVEWIPGTDHAGIATQNVVERLLGKEGTTRFDVGRDAFVERVRAYVRETGDTILQQIRALGASCDWSRTYYTFSDELSRAVRETFVAWYQRDLIYRGKYIINWCPRCLTALSNEEAEKQETNGTIWRVRYEVEDAKGSIVVATTRPETILGDTGVGVHPGDKRYAKLVGKRVRVPLADRLVPVVADDAVDQEFGTGAVKLTPAHDPLDFEIAGRAGLPAIDVLTPEARMAETVPERFQGLDRFEARKRVVAELEALGLIVSAEPHTNAVARCYRCDTVVEPRLSDQWFVRMKRLGERAHAAYRDGSLSFVPERWGTVYDQWMEGIRDWCISRQLWWGHRIPVWYCDTCGTTTASVTDLFECKGCHGQLRQDEDVLDTWFSSQLVPFSSLGWPDRTRDLARFYPGNVLVTGPDIIFFWVARMVMSGLDAMGQLPFTTVYLTGIVRDTKHQKMSKSRGNGIDPLAVIERFGADALRFVTLSGAAVGTDVILDPDDLETSFGPGRNFANKLWNAGRFILSSLEGPVRPLAGKYPHVVKKEELTLADRWIIARCDAAVRETTQAYERYRLNEAVGAAYRFLWSDLADWYIEQAKPRLYGDQPGGDVARAVLARVFDVALKLLHPVMPFITETLWQRLPGRAEGDSIEAGPWPIADERATDPTALSEFALIQELVGAVRSIRAEYAVQPGHAIRVTIADPSAAARRALAAEEGTVRRLAKISALSTGGSDDDGTGAAHAVLQDGTTVTVPLGDLIDIDRECARLGTEVERLSGLIAGQEKKLGNEQFTSRAPEAVVAKEREKLASWREQAETLRRKRAQLRLRGVKRAAVLFTVLVACARIAAPPGGPPDKVAPLLIATVPDSTGILPDFKEAAEFQFNEVVSEGGQPNFGLGTGDLERLILLSPTKEVPHIGWHHSRITVRPREGWQPNRVYRVELLAGVRDLRNNTAKSSAIITFTTGAPLPTDSVLGIAVDWSTQRTARGALIEAVLQPDSLVYRTQADSTGRFHFAPLPAGEYVVYSVLDANRNNRRDEREAFDSVRVKAGAALAGELWMFKHDTLGPRIQAASTSDSMTATISFVGPLDPYQRLSADSAVVRLLPDSTLVKVEFVLPQQTYDSLARAQRAAEDSLKRAAAPDSVRVRDSVRTPPRDTARRTPTDSGPRIVGVPRQVTGARTPPQDTLANQPLKTKPPLFDKLMVRVAERWRDSSRYVIEVHGVRTVSGTAGVARTLLNIPPKPPPPKIDSTAIKPDSAAAKPDSLQPARDTTRRDTTAVRVRRTVLPTFRR